MFVKENLVIPLVTACVIALHNLAATRARLNQAGGGYLDLRGVNVKQRVWWSV